MADCIGYPTPKTSIDFATDANIITEVVTSDQVKTPSVASDGKNKTTLEGYDRIAKDVFSGANGIDRGAYTVGGSYTNYNDYFTYDNAGTPQQWSVKTPNNGGPTLPYPITTTNPSSDANLVLRGDASQEYVNQKISEMTTSDLSYENESAGNSFGGFSLQEFLDLFPGGKLDRNRSMTSSNSPVAHRGVSTTFPENTLIAIREAQGRFDYVEVDIRRTSDGEWVLMHDATVDRTTDGTGNIADLTLSQVKALDAGTWKNATVFEGERVPTLRECLEQCRSSGLKCYVEIKQFTIDSTQANEINSIIESMGMLDKVIILSENPVALEVFRALNRHIELGYVYSAPSVTELNRILAGWPAAAIVNSSNIDQSLIDLCRERGIPVDAYTVDDTATGVALSELGVRRIITNGLVFGGLK